MFVIVNKIIIIKKWNNNVNNNELASLGYNIKVIIIIS